MSDKVKESKLREAFDKIKSEMTDHLDAINENTTEINSNTDYIKQLEIMILKLEERLDIAEMKLSESNGEKTFSYEEFEGVVLTQKEKEIFMILYETNGDLLDYKKIARSLGLTEELVRKYIAGIINKGIPIIKKYFDDRTYLVLDADFRNLQAKKNVLRL
ncbi:MAG: HTH domain-containing protein [Nanoarchaeota archaeon]